MEKMYSRIKLILEEDFKETYDAQNANLEFKQPDEENEQLMIINYHQLSVWLFFNESQRECRMKIISSINVSESLNGKNKLEEYKNEIKFISQDVDLINGIFSDDITDRWTLHII